MAKSSCSGLRPEARSAERDSRRLAKIEVRQDVLLGKEERFAALARSELRVALRRGDAISRFWLAYSSRRGA
jgi:hypothetical protein